MRTYWHYLYTLIMTLLTIIVRGNNVNVYLGRGFHHNLNKIKYLNIKFTLYTLFVLFIFTNQHKNILRLKYHNINHSSCKIYYVRFT